MNTPENVALTPQSSPDMGRLMELALEKGGAESVAVLERLVALQERVIAGQRAAEWSQAMSAFQAECPPIPKESVGKVVGRSGAAFSYKYAELETIARVANPVLARHGLSYSWDTWFSEDGGRVRVTCFVRHCNGHSVASQFECPTDVATQAMSPQQRMGNAQTYAKRYSLVAALGLTTCDPDTDGASDERVSQAQVEQLEAAIFESGADRSRFLGYMGISALEEMMASEYPRAMSALAAKRSKT